MAAITICSSLGAQKNKVSSIKDRNGRDLTEAEDIKKQTNYFVNKGLSSQSYPFSSSRVGMLELDYKES